MGDTNQARTEKLNRVQLRLNGIESILENSGDEIIWKKGGVVICTQSMLFRLAVRVKSRRNCGSFTTICIRGWCANGHIRKSNEYEANSMERVRVLFDNAETQHANHINWSIHESGRLWPSTVSSSKEHTRPDARMYL